MPDAIFLDILLIMHVPKLNFHQTPIDFVCETGLLIGIPPISVDGDDWNVRILCLEPINMNSVVQ